VEQRERTVLLPAQLGIEQHDIERRADDPIERRGDRIDSFDFDAGQRGAGSRDDFVVCIDDQDVPESVLHERQPTSRPTV
jgi:hypothetical protein